MTLNTFIPDLWAARLLVNLQKAQIYTQDAVINRDYEGDIQQAGDTVLIHNIGAVTVGTYTKNSNMSAAETLSDGETTLSIDQAKYFNFQIDDVDKAQQKPKVMDGAMQEAAYALRDTADQYVASLYSGIDSGNLIGSTATPKTDLATTGQPYKYLIDLKVLLDDDKVPTDARWVIIPPWYHGLLLQDAKFVQTGSAQAEARLTNGEVGMAAGFRVFVSNNVPNTSSAKYRIIAGHKIAWTFAEQVRSVEAYRPELRFADAVKGLHLYGAKLVRSTALACLTANIPS